MVPLLVRLRHTGAGRREGVVWVMTVQILLDVRSEVEIMVLFTEREKKKSYIHTEGLDLQTSCPN